jgi:hypothetical protein
MKLLSFSKEENPGAIRKCVSFNDTLARIESCAVSRPSKGIARFQGAWPRIIPMNLNNPGLKSGVIEKKSCQAPARIIYEEIILCGAHEMK